MPLNVRGGKGAKKRKNKPPPPALPGVDLYKKEGQEYGYVIDELGDRRFRIRIIIPQYVTDELEKENKTDNTEPTILLARVCGKLKGRSSGKNWSIKKSSYVLVSLRDFEPSRCDIIHNYKANEIDYLKKNKELPYFNQACSGTETGAKIIYKKTELTVEPKSQKNNSEDTYLNISFLPSSEDEYSDDDDVDPKKFRSGFLNKSIDEPEKDGSQSEPE